MLKIKNLGFGEPELHSTAHTHSVEVLIVRISENLGDYFFGALPAYFRLKRSMRPAVSSSFCLPVKKGWQLEQISTRSMLPFIVDLVLNVCPQAQ